MKCSAAPPIFRLLFCCLNCAQRFDYRAHGSRRKLGEATEHLIDGSEKRISRLSFEFWSPQVIERRSKDKDEPNNRQGAVYKIKCSDYQASYIGETGRNLNTRLTEHKRATKNGDANNHIAVHHQLTNHDIDWDSAQCLTYSTNYFQRLFNHLFE